MACVFGGRERESPLEDSDTKRAICSIAQSIIYGVSNHNKFTPKHIRHALALHQATRSESLVQLLNAANHTIGIKTIHRIDNAIANNILNKFVANGYYAYMSLMILTMKDSYDAHAITEY